MLHEEGSLLSENCKMGQKIISFYRIRKNKEEKTRKYVIDWGHGVSLVWGEKGRRWLGSGPGWPVCRVSARAEVYGAAGGI